MTQKNNCKYAHIFLLLHLRYDILIYVTLSDIVDTEPSDGNVWKMLLGATDRWFDDDEIEVEDDDEDDDEDEDEDHSKTEGWKWK